jgi:hypothetical protein
LGQVELRPALWGTQAQRRRWLKWKFLGFPASALLFFLYKYVFRLGFLDGRPGLIYAGLQAMQMFHIKAKLFEMRQGTGGAGSTMRAETDSAGTKTAFEAPSRAVR